MSILCVSVTASVHKSWYLLNMSIVKETHIGVVQFSVVVGNVAASCAPTVMLPTTTHTANARLTAAPTIALCNQLTYNAIVVALLWYRSSSSSSRSSSSSSSSSSSNSSSKNR